ncbi:MAG TPA: hypothetical protein VKB27_12805 [Gammaproteobacteria bacterium]|nr:hypothetical protein [Gammaproteobacteria bacterium]
MNLAERLHRHGLFLRGVVRLEARELECHELPADKPCCALVGNIGSSYWDDFNGSAEYRDGLADPLDRWSRRIAKTIAAEYELLPVYPFEGPPYYPFQQWAHRAEGLEQSPLGIRIHPRHGLWHSYRFALLGADIGLEKTPSGAMPCLDCADQPCLHRCPAEAFTGNGYDVDACADYLMSTPRAECHALGCMARNACPAAPHLRYLPAQSSFHLRAFLQARAKS